MIVRVSIGASVRANRNFSLHSQNSRAIVYPAVHRQSLIVENSLKQMVFNKLSTRYGLQYGIHG